jgi:AraC-like DNA-binding protein
VTPGSTAAMIASDRSPTDRRFKTATGQTPRAYLQRIRIQAAKRLLETTTDPVDHLRAQVGYGDPTAFRRAFRRDPSRCPGPPLGIESPRAVLLSYCRGPNPTPVTCPGWTSGRPGWPALRCGGRAEWAVAKGAR